MNSINIPRYYNGNLVYDEIPYNNIITAGTNEYNCINITNGILVNDNGSPSFKTFNGILYYDNNLLKSYELTANTLIYVNNNKELQYVNLSGENNKILYVNNNSIETLKLESNHILYTNNNGELSQTEITEGVLNTYKFDDNSVDTSNQVPSFTDKIVLNNCEIVNDGNQRINKNYLIYGNSSKHGLSPIELDTPSNNYEYYYIVNDLNNNINVSTSSQIYTDLYNTVVNQESIQVPTISAIPICKSNETNQQLALIIPKMFNSGDYFININSGKTKFSLKNISGSILPSSLYSDDKNYFNYRKYNIYTATSNQNEFTLLKSSSTQFNEPYLSGYGWKDLTTTTFLNSNNLSITESLIYSNPVVIGTNGSMYGVILPENKKYILTKSTFKELQITGSDISINDTNKINLKNIIQIKNDSKLYKLEDTTLSSGILHTTIDGDINISLLTNNDIQDNTITGNKIALNTLSGSKIISNTITGDKIAGNTITGDKIALTTITNNNIKDKTITNGKIADNTITTDKIVDNTITGGKLFFNDDSQQSWSNIIIDQDNNLYRKYGDFFINSNYYGVFDYNGNIQSLCANIITKGTMNGDRISEETLQYNRLKISTDPQTSNWSIIEVNSNNNFIKFSNTLSLNNQYGVFDYNGNIVQLTADKISGRISDMIANGSIGSNHLANSSVTTEKIKDNAVTMDKIAQGAVGVTQIANNSITGSKLNINGTKPSGTWKNLLIDSNTNFVTTDARVTNYGVFNNEGGVQELNAALLNNLGFNLYTPENDDNDIDQTIISANCIFYTNSIKNNYVNTNYIKVYNYFNGNNSSNKILYTNNTGQFTDSYGNIKNTYEAFYKITSNLFNIKLKTSLYIKDVEFDLRSNTNYFYKNTSGDLNILNDNIFFQSSILMIGVYTSLCKINNANNTTQVIMLPNKLFKYTDNNNYCRATLLGYLPIDVSELQVGEINNIIINKTFDFECTVIKDKISYDYNNHLYMHRFEDIENDLLYFVPMYYIDNNNNTVRELFYSDTELSALDKSKTYASNFYKNICLNNDDSLTITYNNETTTITKDNITISNDNIIIKYEDAGIGWTNGRKNIYISNDKNVFMDLSSIDPNDLTSVDTIEKTLTLHYFLNEPIEKNIKFNLSPITNKSNIIYRTKNTETNELDNTITYKFSLCSITLSFAKNTGQYPVIIE